MGAVENIKEVADLVKKFNDIDLNRRILALENEVLDLSRDKRRAEERIEELERTLQLKGKLTFKEPFYWIEKDSAPYCAACWEDKHKAVHVVVFSENNNGVFLDCPVCAHRYTLRTVHWANLRAEHR